jgi:hypothetical protein
MNSKREPADLTLKADAVPAGGQNGSGIFEYLPEHHGEPMRFNPIRGNWGVWECRQCNHVVSPKDVDEMVAWAKRSVP